MRFRATAATLTTALALSALAVPAVHAADRPDVPDVPQSAPFAAKAPAKSGAKVKITKVVVNGGKDIVVGTVKKKKVTIAVTATHPSGIQEGYAMLWHGKKFSETGIDSGMVPAADRGKCTKVNKTTSTCKVTVVADPNENIYRNALAGKWKVWAGAAAKNGASVIKDTYKTVSVKRYAKLTVNAAPEPVKKGRTITVTGALTRANWDSGKYAGYTKQPVKLEFKKKGSSTYKALKTVRTDGKGKLRTTVKASVDGTFRYVFAGTSTTPSVKSTGDFVDVK
ncbi:calcium-binding protein [Streptomyces sp. NPDC059009]|uniref:calcium-binding protein n=1 Tax=Streptomyces sp. NPDC059009 TaxID=3346694 RepID=UPI0036834D05